MIPIHRENITMPEDFFGELCHALPGIVPHVSMAQLYSSASSVVSPKGGSGWIWYILLYSRVSSKHVLDVYPRVVEVFKKVLDDASGSSSNE